MSVASLEKFNKQFSAGELRTVAQLLQAEKKGEFSFYIPTSDKLDTAVLVDRIESCLPQLIEVVRAPYIILKSEYTQVRTELASNLTPQGIQMTVKDPKLWKKKGKKIVPEYVYAKTNEDEYNTYENRVVRSLIDKVIRFLNLPMEYAKDGVKNMYEAYFQSSSLNKLDLVKLIDSDLYKNSDPRSFTDYKKLFYLRGKLTQLRNSSFYKIMSNCPRFSGRPEATNLFIHNANYHGCFKLWRFLDEFYAGLSLLTLEQQKSVYCAFVSLAMIDCYVRQGFKIIKDVQFSQIEKDFRLQDFCLTNDLFNVVINADPDKITVLVQCAKMRSQQTTVIELHTDISEPYSKNNQFVVSMHKTDYSDRAACVVPGNKNSLKDLESIVRCTVFTFEADKSIYSRLCLICGSNVLDDKGYFYKCEDCGAVYSFIDDKTVWINQFNVLTNEEEQPKNI